MVGKTKDHAQCKIDTQAVFAHKQCIEQILKGARVFGVTLLVSK